MSRVLRYLPEGQMSSGETNQARGEPVPTNVDLMRALPEPFQRSRSGRE
jgi:hypothetical protein